MTTGHALASIAVMAGVTFLTRALPFLLFDRGERPPKLVLYLGQVLPYAVTGLLVVYCLRSVSVLRAPFGLPELAALAVIAAAHLWKKNTLLSLLAGTATYMLMVQVVF